MASILKVNEIQHTGGTTALTVDTNGRLLVWDQHSACISFLHHSHQ